MKIFLGFLLIGIGIVIALYVFYNNAGFNAKTRPFSHYSLLVSSWEKYKLQFINKDGRVIDHAQNGVTTSEGQSYAMLRSVWVDDKPAFDSVWKWTKENLKRPNDNLFGWRWGKRVDGTYGFLTDGGENTASDGDSDIVLALIFASKRWNDTTYLAEAQKIINDIWDIETTIVLQKRYLIAGNWAEGQNRIIINPSYFSPYAWRIFATVDKSHDWESLIDPSYEILNTVGNTPLDRGKSVGLPPDWIAIRKSDGVLENAQLDSFSTDYSFNAMRVPFRIAIDYLWYKEPKAKNYLLSSFKILHEQYGKEGKLGTSYSHAGDEIIHAENPVMYATILGYFSIADSKLASNIYQDKILTLYSNDKDSFNQNLPYYEQNWLWFGAAFYNNFLTNYAHNNTKG